MDLTQVSEEDFETEANRRKSVKDKQYRDLCYQRYQQHEVMKQAALAAALAVYGIPADKADDVYADCMEIYYEWDS